MTFLLKVRKYFYIAKCNRINKKPKNTILRRATDQEVSAHLASKNEIDMAVMKCTNPACNGKIQITRKQKFMFLVTYPLRYRRFVRIYCSQLCQESHTKAIVEGREQERIDLPSIEDFERELETVQPMNY